MQLSLSIKETVLDNTQSVCPVCLEVIDARIVTEGRAVHMKKECPEHGAFQTYVWPDVDHYNWMRSFRLPLVKPEKTVPSLKGCPQDCGPCTSHLRRPTLVELELTERCNLRCPVCFMAAEELQAVAKTGPSLACLGEIFRSVMTKTGPDTSIQLTGGEPTTRRDLFDIIRLGREIGFNAIELNTNGVVLAQNPDYAEKLAEAGVSGVYLQFDGLTSDVYVKIRGEDLLAKKLQAIDNCRLAGIQVVLAMTIIRGINEQQIGDVLEFALENRDVIAGLAYQPAFGSGRFEVSQEERLTMGDVAFMLAGQSNGIIQPYDIWPLGCSHPLCSSATHLIEDGRGFIPLTRLLSPEEYVRHFDPNSPQGSVFADIAAVNYPEKGPGLSIVVMNYMDSMSIDLKRLKECSMTVAGSDGGLIPFCSYQLTNIDGKKKAELIAGKTV